MKIQKSVISALLITFLLSIATGCRVASVAHKSNTTVIQANPNGKIPPGQLKKATGAQSAKEYAPGQNKKHKKDK